MGTPKGLFAHFVCIGHELTVATFLLKTSGGFRKKHGMGRSGTPEQAEDLLSKQRAEHGEWTNLRGFLCAISS